MTVLMSSVLRCGLPFRSWPVLAFPGVRLTRAWAKMRHAPHHDKRLTTPARQLSNSPVRPRWGPCMTALFFGTHVCLCGLDREYACLAPSMAAHEIPSALRLSRNKSATAREQRFSLQARLSMKSAGGIPVPSKHWTYASPLMPSESKEKSEFQKAARCRTQAGNAFDEGLGRWARPPSEACEEAWAHVEIFVKVLEGVCTCS